jgi:hypothetical protein
VVPVQGHGQVRRHEQVTAQDRRPVHDTAEGRGQVAHRLQPLIRRPVGIAQGDNRVAVEHPARSPAEAGQALGVSGAVELVHAQAELARVAGASQVGQNAPQMRLGVIPDAVGHHLVEPKAELGPATGQGQQEFGVQERLAAGEAEHADAVSARLLEKADRGRDVEAVRPLDRHATVRAGQVALVGWSQH